MSQLYEESIFISIGHREFQIPRDVFNDPGNSPNFFSLGFAVLFSHPDEVFPGLDREHLIRPPSIMPASVPNRSADTFEEILRLLKGYPLRIRDEAHRQELLRDARYFHFKGLEQRLVPHSISYNQLRGRDEIVLRLENVQKSGINVAPDQQLSPSPASSVHSASADPLAGWISYARPFVDTKPAELVLEIGGESTKIHFTPGGAPRAEFFNDTRARVARLFEVIATKLNLPPTTQPLGLLMASGGAGSQPATPGNTPLSEDLVRVAFEPESAIVLDGRDRSADAALGVKPARADDEDEDEDMASQDGSAAGNPRKRQRTLGGAVAAGGVGVQEAWTVRTGQWRLRIQGTKSGKSAVECVLVAVKIDAVSSELGRNTTRDFLGS